MQPVSAQAKTPAAVSFIKFSNAMILSLYNSGGYLPPAVACICSPIISPTCFVMLRLFDALVFGTAALYFQLLKRDLLT
jgi:hypothetical protein